LELIFAIAVRVDATFSGGNVMIFGPF